MFPEPSTPCKYLSPPTDSTRQPHGWSVSPCCCSLCLGQTTPFTITMGRRTSEPSTPLGPALRGGAGQVGPGGAVRQVAR